MRYIFGVLLLCMVSACAPPISREILPTPAVVTITIPEFLDPQIRNNIAACATDTPEIGLVFTNGSNPDVVISLGEPLNGIQGAAYQIGQDSVIIITHHQNELREPDIIELQDIFTSSTPDYEVWAYPAENTIRRYFDSIILGGNELSPSAWIAPNPMAMLDVISNHENAIGYLPASWENESVTDVTPSNIEKALNYPILALTSFEPNGGIQKFINCLQSGSN